MFVLPENLATAIREILKTRPARQWQREAQALSRRYRGQREILPSSFAHGEEQALAYLAQIFPATYAQLYGAMAATKAQAPAWQPLSLLDLGSGPGTALWAGLEQWPSLKKLEAWEREASFIAIGQKLAQASEQDAIRNCHWQKLDLRRRLPKINQTYDLVIIGHVLNELSAADQQRVVEYAWEHCAGLLLLVEPGTSAAFPAIQKARERLLALGARTLAPCPHEQPCPLVDDWCHFPQRLQRPSFQRRAKAAISQWEDCKFSYAAMARFAPAHAPWARIIRAPQVTKVYAEVQLCTATGVVRQREDRKNREVFKRLTKLRWGAVVAG
ncbi:MAG: small ribosomal subunit Rsm22 family protein [candidate division KSB1 bacterium]|nr:small ribosomal subunit Rsm22 family protein [candidate division KSB1 bacterium]MDZ7365615.1 small ribosomal subunit Rsm22 family protein [candidate division KSB1 bacterium]MDZ7403309.1 small ribosomal subunit Rsm22 family protein [candidate division KSB1 bacterium]